MSDKEYILNLIEQGHSVVLRDQILAYIGDDKQRMATLMSYFFHDNWVYNQRAAWPVGLIGEKKPEMIKPYIKKLVSGLPEAKHDAVLRNTLRIFQKMDIPEDIQGDLYEICINLFIDLKQPIAVRVFSMSVLANIAEPYKELRQEVLDLVYEFLPLGSAGYKSRAKKVIKLLSKNT